MYVYYMNSRNEPTFLLGSANVLESESGSEFSCLIMLTLFNKHLSQGAGYITDNFKMISSHNYSMLDDKNTKLGLMLFKTFLHQNLKTISFNFHWPVSFEVQPRPTFHQLCGHEHVQLESADLSPCSFVAWKHLKSQTSFTQDSFVVSPLVCQPYLKYVGISFFVC